MNAIQAGFALAVLAAAAQASQVFVVGPGALPNVATALTLAADGDVILLRPGAAAANFTIDGLGVSVIADSGAPIATGQVQVRNLPAGSTVVLAGLQMAGGFHGLNDVGAVRLQRCSMFGFGSQGTGASLTNCANVAFADCLVRGGSDNLYGAAPGFFGSASALVLDRTSVQGGNGLWGNVAGFPVLHPAAVGANLTAFTLHASGSSVVGGQGASLPLVVRGVPGDRAFLAIAPAPAFVPTLAQSGVRLFQTPARRLFLGTIDASGVLSTTLPVSDLGPGVQSQRWFAQAVTIDTGGQVWLASPACLTLLDASF